MNLVNSDDFRSLGRAFGKGIGKLRKLVQSSSANDLFRWTKNRGVAPFYTRFYIKFHGTFATKQADVAKRCNCFSTAKMC